MSLTAIWIGLTAGTYLYQAATHQDWDRAFEVSWTHTWAFLCLWAAMKIQGYEFRKVSLTSTECQP